MGSANLVSWRLAGCGLFFFRGQLLASSASLLPRGYFLLVCLRLSNPRGPSAILGAIGEHKFFKNFHQAMKY